MIGSHDTFTYCKSTKWIFNHAKKYWKTQCKSIEEQYKWGVRMFDIRVMSEKNFWRTCHGECKLTKCFLTLRDICDFMKKNCPDAIYRIVLEKGADSRFKQEALHNNFPDFDKKYGTATLCDIYPNLWRVDIKATGVWTGTVCNNNQKLFERGYKFALVDTWTPPSYEIHGEVKCNNILKIDLRKKARQLNKEIFNLNNIDELKESKDFLYFIDYCTNEY